VYSLLDGRYLYLLTKVPPDAIIGRREKHGVITVTANGEEYPCVIASEHTRDKVIAVTESLTSLRGLDSVAGMNDLKRLLINDVINPLLNPEKYKKFRLSIPNAILLYGPPGCGKTFIVKKLAEELSYHMFQLKARLSPRRDAGDGGRVRPRRAGTAVPRRWCGIKTAEAGCYTIDLNHWLW
jgi:transitional endoplasmic reticulum ATPase